TIKKGKIVLNYKFSNDLNVLSACIDKRNHYVIDRHTLSTISSNVVKNNNNDNNEMKNDLAVDSTKQKAENDGNVIIKMTSSEKSASPILTINTVKRLEEQVISDSQIKTKISMEQENTPNTDDSSSSYSVYEEFEHIQVTSVNQPIIRLSVNNHDNNNSSHDSLLQDENQLPSSSTQRLHRYNENNDSMSSISSKTNFHSKDSALGLSDENIHRTEQVTDRTDNNTENMYTSATTINLRNSTTATDDHCQCLLKHDLTGLFNYRLRDNVTKQGNLYNKDETNINENDASSKISYPDIRPTVTTDTTVGDLNINDSTTMIYNNNDDNSTHDGRAISSSSSEQLIPKEKTTGMYYKAFGSAAALQLAQQYRCEWIQDLNSPQRPIKSFENETLPTEILESNDDEQMRSKNPINIIQYSLSQEIGDSDEFYLSPCLTTSCSCPNLLNYLESEFNTNDADHFHTLNNYEHSHSLSDLDQYNNKTITKETLEQIWFSLLNLAYSEKDDFELTEYKRRHIAGLSGSYTNIEPIIEKSRSHNDICRYSNSNSKTMATTTKSKSFDAGTLLQRSQYAPDQQQQQDDNKTSNQGLLDGAPITTMDPFDFYRTTPFNQTRRNVEETNIERTSPSEPIAEPTDEKSILLLSTTQQNSVEGEADRISDDSIESFEESNPNIIEKEKQENNTNDIVNITHVEHEYVGSPSQGFMYDDFPDYFTNTIRSSQTIDVSSQQQQSEKSFNSYLSNPSLTNEPFPHITQSETVDLNQFLPSTTPLLNEKTLLDNNSSGSTILDGDLSPKPFTNENNNETTNLIQKLLSNALNRNTSSSSSLSPTTSKNETSDDGNQFNYVFHYPNQHRFLDDDDMRDAENDFMLDSQYFTTAENDKELPEFGGFDSEYASAAHDEAAVLAMATSNIRDTYTELALFRPHSLSTIPSSRASQYASSVDSDDVFERDKNLKKDVNDIPLDTTQLHQKISYEEEEDEREEADSNISSPQSRPLSSIQSRPTTPDYNREQQQLQSKEEQPKHSHYYNIDYEAWTKSITDQPAFYDLSVKYEDDELEIESKHNEIFTRTTLLSPTTIIDSIVSIPDEISTVSFNHTDKIEIIPSTINVHAQKTDTLSIVDSDKNKLDRSLSYYIERLPINENENLHSGSDYITDSNMEYQKSQEIGSAPATVAPDTSSTRTSMSSIHDTHLDPTELAYRLSRLSGNTSSNLAENTIHSPPKKTLADELAEIGEHPRTSSHMQDNDSLDGELFDLEQQFFDGDSLNHTPPSRPSENVFLLQPTTTTTNDSIQELFGIAQAAKSRAEEIKAKKQIAEDLSYHLKTFPLLEQQQEHESIKISPTIETNNELNFDFVKGKNTEEIIESEKQKHTEEIVEVYSPTVVQQPSPSALFHLFESETEGERNEKEKNIESEVQTDSQNIENLILIKSQILSLPFDGEKKITSFTSTNNDTPLIKQTDDLIDISPVYSIKTSDVIYTTTTAKIEPEIFDDIITPESNISELTTIVRQMDFTSLPSVHNLTSIVNDIRKSINEKPPQINSLVPIVNDTLNRKNIDELTRIKHDIFEINNNKQFTLTNNLESNIYVHKEQPLDNLVNIVNQIQNNTVKSDILSSSIQPIVKILPESDNTKLSSSAMYDHLTQSKSDIYTTHIPSRSRSTRYSNNKENEEERVLSSTKSQESTRLSATTEDVERQQKLLISPDIRIPSTTVSDFTQHPSAYRTKPSVDSTTFNTNSYEQKLNSNISNRNNVPTLPSSMFHVPLISRYSSLSSPPRGLSAPAYPGEHLLRDPYRHQFQTQRINKVCDLEIVKQGKGFKVGYVDREGTDQRVILTKRFDAGPDIMARKPNIPYRGRKILNQVLSGVLHTNGISSLQEDTKYERLSDDIEVPTIGTNPKHFDESDMISIDIDGPSTMLNSICESIVITQGSVYIDNGVQKSKERVKGEQNAQHTSRQPSQYETSKTAKASSSSYIHDRRDQDHMFKNWSDKNEHQLSSSKLDHIVVDKREASIVEGDGYSTPIRPKKDKVDVVESWHDHTVFEGDHTANWRSPGQSQWSSTTTKQRSSSSHNIPLTANRSIQPSSTVQHFISTVNHPVQTVTMRSSSPTRFSTKAIYDVPDEFNWKNSDLSSTSLEPPMFTIPRKQNKNRDTADSPIKDLLTPPRPQKQYHTTSTSPITVPSTTTIDRSCQYSPPMKIAYHDLGSQCNIDDIYSLQPRISSINSQTQVYIADIPGLTASFGAQTIANENNKKSDDNPLKADGAALDDSGFATSTRRTSQFSPPSSDTLDMSTTATDTIKTTPWISSKEFISKLEQTNRTTKSESSVIDQPQLLTASQYTNDNYYLLTDSESKFRATEQRKSPSTVQQQIISRKSTLTKHTQPTDEDADISSADSPLRVQQQQQSTDIETTPKKKKDFQDYALRTSDESDVERLIAKTTFQPSRMNNLTTSDKPRYHYSEPDLLNDDTSPGSTTTLNTRSSHVGAQNNALSGAKSSEQMDAGKWSSSTAANQRTSLERSGDSGILNETFVDDVVMTTNNTQTFRNRRKLANFALQVDIKGSSSDSEEFSENLNVTPYSQRRSTSNLLDTSSLSRKRTLTASPQAQSTATNLSRTESTPNVIIETSPMSKEENGQPLYEHQSELLIHAPRRHRSSTHHANIRLNNDRNSSLRIQMPTTTDDFSSRHHHTRNNQQPVSYRDVGTSAGELERQIDALRRERAHILDLLSLNWDRSKIWVELTEAKLNYIIGETDALLRSLSFDTTPMDTENVKIKMHQYEEEMAALTRQRLAVYRQRLEDSKKQLDIRIGELEKEKSLMQQAITNKRDYYSRRRQQATSAIDASSSITSNQTTPTTTSVIDQSQTRHSQDIHSTNSAASQPTLVLNGTKRQSFLSSSAENLSNVPLQDTVASHPHLLDVSFLTPNASVASTLPPKYPYQSQPSVQNQSVKSSAQTIQRTYTPQPKITYDIHLPRVSSIRADVYVPIRRQTDSRRSANEVIDDVLENEHQLHRSSLDGTTNRFSSHSSALPSYGTIRYPSYNNNNNNSFNYTNPSTTTTQNTPHYTTYYVSGASMTTSMRNGENKNPTSLPSTTPTNLSEMQGLSKSQQSILDETDKLVRDSQQFHTESASQFEHARETLLSSSAMDMKIKRNKKWDMMAKKHPQQNKIEASIRLARANRISPSNHRTYLPHDITLAELFKYEESLAKEAIRLIPSDTTSHTNSNFSSSMIPSNHYHHTTSNRTTIENPTSSTRNYHRSLINQPLKSTES
ncbi:unnamed protein product, partial [Didymodactylos carnosus]